MSTQHDIGKEQEVPPQALPPLHRQETLPEEKVSPAQTFPRPPRPKANRWVVIGAVIVALAIIVSLGVIFIPGQLQRPGVKDPAYWDPIIGTQSGVNKVESVSLANIMGTSALQALVTVRYTGTDARLDVYVYNNISSAKPAQVFKLPDLVKGDAKISGYNTVMTAEVDKNSTLNAGKPVSAMTVDLFREFQWSNSDGKFVQVAFPGIFPDLTRYQAEADQALVNQGHDTWKNDPQAVARALAARFFGWQRTLTTKVLSGGGSQDVDATVQVQEAPVQGGPTLSPSAIVTLSRLQGNTHNMWVAIGVEDGTALTLTNIQPKSLVASPVKLEGKESAFENTVGMAYILDHLYTRVGQAIVTGKTGPGMGTVTYATQVSYDTSFKQGPQEGIVEVQLTTPVEAGPETVVMVKVLLDPQPRVALGPASCPIAQQQPGYWKTVLGIDTSTASVGTASCGNLKGDSSLQALVLVYYTNGQPGVTYVYDHITDAHPVQLFKLQTTSAMISSVSTIITRDADLYREFQWSSTDGKFVQVVFPGMYPDLTRGQAEADQAAVNNGQDSWKLDAVKTTQHWNLIGGTAKLATGGGPERPHCRGECDVSRCRRPYYQYSSDPGDAESPGWKPHRHLGDHLGRFQLVVHLHAQEWRDDQQSGDGNGVRPTV